MMSLLMTPLLAAAVAGDQHAEVLAQRRSEAVVAEAPLAAPLLLAQAGRPPRGDGMPPGPHGAGPPHFGPPYLRALTLTDAQQDRIFEIQHAQEPQLRQQSLAWLKAHQELRLLAQAERFDEARAAALAESFGRAQAAIALLNARSEAAIWQVLTPEQRQKVAEMYPPVLLPRQGLRPR